MYWMGEANSRYKISVLNYAVTSNHIHILLTNNRNENSIPKAMQLVSGRVAQEYNIRKRRKGPFWEDRYHATAVESGNHLLNCMVYIDLNMVRAGVVKHPLEYPYCGYQEISGQKERHNLIDRRRLVVFIGADLSNLKDIYERRIKENLEKTGWEREDKWTSSLAVGSQKFIEGFKLKIGIRARNRVIENKQDLFILRESRVPYGEKEG